MTAPDKIYLSEDAPRAYDWQITPFKKGGNIEYIRKDALLEWANNMLSLRRDTGDDYFIPAIVVLNDLIDKLNSM